MHPIREINTTLDAQKEVPQVKDYKDDAEKPIAGALFEDFPRALLEIAKLATIGAKKYERSSWLLVRDGRRRYTDAMGRHVLENYISPIDLETGLPHDVAVAWNAMARLELRLREEETNRNV